MIALILTLALYLCLTIIPELGVVNEFFDHLSSGFLATNIVIRIFFLGCFLILYEPVRRVLASYEYEAWYKSFDDEWYKTKGFSWTSVVETTRSAAIGLRRVSQRLRLRTSRHRRDPSYQGPGEVAL